MQFQPFCITFFTRVSIQILFSLMSSFEKKHKKGGSKLGGGGEKWFIYSLSFLEKSQKSQKQTRAVYFRMNPSQKLLHPILGNPPPTIFFFAAASDCLSNSRLLVNNEEAGAGDKHIEFLRLWPICTHDAQASALLYLMMMRRMKMDMQKRLDFHPQSSHSVIRPRTRSVYGYKMEKWSSSSFMTILSSKYPDWCLAVEMCPRLRHKMSPASSPSSAFEPSVYGPLSPLHFS